MIRLYHLFFYNFIVKFGCCSINNTVKDRESQETADAAAGEQLDIEETQQREDPIEEREGKCRMDPGCYKRQEEYGQHLRIDGPAHFPVAHSYVLQDGESLLVFISFRDLFVVQDQHGSDDEQKSQENSDEKQAGKIRQIRFHFTGTTLDAS